MTNYEWIVTNEKEIIEVILTDYIGKEKGKVSLCNETCCSDCDFKSSLNNNQMCGKTTKEWLKAEYEQESTLDKISKEIDELRNYSYPMSDMIFDDVQKIIDKYKE